MLRTTEIEASQGDVGYLVIKSHFIILSVWYLAIKSSYFLFSDIRVLGTKRQYNLAYEILNK